MLLQTCNMHIYAEKKKEKKKRKCVRARKSSHIFLCGSLFVLHVQSNRLTVYALPLTYFGEHVVLYAHFQQLSKLLPNVLTHSFVANDAQLCS